jgi:hypothetical protein
LVKRAMIFAGGISQYPLRCLWKLPGRCLKGLPHAVEFPVFLPSAGISATSSVYPSVHNNSALPT